MQYKNNSCYIPNTGKSSIPFRRKASILGKCYLFEIVKVTKKFATQRKIQNYKFTKLFGRSNLFKNIQEQFYFNIVHIAEFNGLNVDKMEKIIFK